ncbi:MAG: hypothetical protein ACK56F_06595 [bacterium]
MLASCVMRAFNDLMLECSCRPLHQTNCMKAMQAVTPQMRLILSLCQPVKQVLPKHSPHKGWFIFYAFRKPFMRQLLTCLTHLNTGRSRSVLQPLQQPCCWARQGSPRIEARHSW